MLSWGAVSETMEMVESLAEDVVLGEGSVAGHWSVLSRYTGKICAAVSQYGLVFLS